MKVLMITGDKRFGPGNERYELQKSAVEQFEVVYWGKGSVWPQIPKGNFDVVTVQDPFWRGLFGWHIARRLKARFNVQVHTDLSVQSFFKHVLSQIILCHADSIRVVSEKIKQQVEHIGVNGKITTLPVFIDIEYFRNIIHTPDLEHTTILWIGRFENEKDPVSAVEIFTEIRKDIDVKLIMLGKGSLEPKLKSVVQNLPIEFPGWQDPKLYLETADVVLCTSKHESFGASIVEALAAGVPVVAPDVGVAKEAGAFVVPRDRLADKVIEVLNNTMRGELKLHLPGREEWAKMWVQTL